MWTCNNNKKVITGSLKTLLVEAGCQIVYDMTSLDSTKDFDLRKPKCINKVIQTLLDEDDEIVAGLNHVFDKLSPFEKIYAVHYVLSHLFNDKCEAPDVSMWMEATIDAFFELIKINVTVELDEEEIDEERFIKKTENAFYTRELIVKSFKENYNKEDEPRIYKKDSKKIKDLNFWICQIDNLKDIVLSLDNFEENLDYSEKGFEFEGENLPKMKIEKKTIVKMIKDILKIEC